MGDKSTDLERHLPLTPAVYHIMLALLDGQRHGYGIMQEVETFTDGRMLLGPGTLYRSIRQMLERGWIAEVDTAPDEETDERRRNYRLTALGRRVLDAETARLGSLVRIARRKLATDRES